MAAAGSAPTLQLPDYHDGAAAGPAPLDDTGAGLATTPIPKPPHLLLSSSYARACAARRAQPTHARIEKTLMLTNCRVLDPVSGTYLEGLQRVQVARGKILSVQRQPDAAGADWWAGVDLRALGLVIDCRGKVLMPGLCDAHVHVTAFSADLAGLMAHPESYVALRAAGVMADMLARGFTTVRDAGGADFGLAQAVDEGVVLGPRLLFTGHALSQTGGHGDFRGRGEDACACGAALRGLGRVCDGDAEVRRAARDELRRGAHCIKVMASGGVASPTDKLSSNQFSEAELRAIVEEAAAVGTYVAAHAYMPAAIKRAVLCGVRSIEHGNFLDEECALLMAERGAYLVPTLVTYQQLMTRGVASGMPQELVAKVGDTLGAGLQSLGLARAHGVIMCYGSDLLGDMHDAQSLEFDLLARELPTDEVLRSATVNCAELFALQFSIGRVAEGYDADLIVVEGDPLADVRLLAAPGGASVVLVLKGGLLAKAPSSGTSAASWEGVNQLLMQQAAA